MERRPFFASTHKYDMHFVYAAFANFEDRVIVKVGRSMTPHSRITQVHVNSPFEIKQAVFAHIGSLKKANKFERLVQNRFANFRTRGEWYLFSRDQSSEFNDGIRQCFHEAACFRLKWTIMNIEAMKAAILEKVKKYRGWIKSVDQKKAA